MKRLIILIPAFIFLFFAIITLPDYGINWDEPYHFERGQAFLHFFLTGNKNYSDLPRYPYFSQECIDSKYGCDSPPGGPSDYKKDLGATSIYEDLMNKRQESLEARRSIFQSEYFNFDWQMTKDITQSQGGHPPTNDILAALTNYIFYQRLGVMGDIESHHLFEVVSVFLIVMAIAIFCYLEFGIIAALVSSTVLAAYPLVFSESHFNIKDPVEMAFFGLSLILFFFGSQRKKWFLLLLSAISFGFALGTKFNVVFLPFIILPWLLVNKNLFKDNWKMYLVYPFVVVFLFYAFWPYLWSDPINNLRPVLNFYFQNGVTLLPEVKGFVYAGFDFFASYWIGITTPIPVLILSLIGLGVSISRFIREKKNVYLLIVLWLLIPIIRVSLPSTAIHSGVRHVMEFIPAMAVLSGVGALYLYSLPKKNVYKVSVLFVIAISIGFSIFNVGRIHPNENVYFNELVGGLKGAVEKNVPYWGYSYGNAYLQGVDWLNKSAEPNSKLSLLLGTTVNIPRLKLRSDIRLDNKYWSGPLNRGEYAIELSYNYSQKDYFRYRYYETFLDPVYEVKVDDVSILKIWKNDRQHLKIDFEKQMSYRPISVKIKKNNLEIDLGKNIDLTELNIVHGSNDCQKQKEGYILTSLDQKNWIREPDLIDAPESQVEVAPSEIGFSDTNFVFFFTGKNARYIIVNTDTQNSCYLKNPIVSVKGLLSN